MNKQLSKIKNILEKLYTKYNRRNSIKPDPLQFVYKYTNRADMEIAGFLAAALAYGRVQQIEKDLDNLLERMGKSPYEFILNFDEKKRKKLKGFKHRFTSGDDISDLLLLFKNVLKRYGSIEKFFVQGYKTSDENIVPGSSKFSDSLLDMYGCNHKNKITKGLSFLLSRPTAGSVCKRLNLFLRWMVRKDNVDAGLWKAIDKSKLIIPIDVHIARLCKILGFYERKTPNLATAVEITGKFAEIEPSDPVKYDFALSRIGIVENCNGRYDSNCEFCELFEICFATKFTRLRRDTKTLRI